MLWSRDGAHNVLQIRSSIASKSWQNDWLKLENKIYQITNIYIKITRVAFKERS